MILLNGLKCSFKTCFFILQRTQLFFWFIQRIFERDAFLNSRQLNKKSKIKNNCTDYITKALVFLWSNLWFFFTHQQSICKFFVRFFHFCAFLNPNIKIKNHLHNNCAHRFQFFTFSIHSIQFNFRIRARSFQFFIFSTISV
jgi:hypothetical protein